MDPLDLVSLLPRAVLRFISVAFVLGFVLFHAQTLRVFDDLVQYESSQKRAQLVRDFKPVIANARHLGRDELRLTRTTAARP